MVGSANSTQHRGGELKRVLRFYYVRLREKRDTSDRVGHGSVRSRPVRSCPVRSQTSPVRVGPVLNGPVRQVRTGPSVRSDNAGPNRQSGPCRSGLLAVRFGPWDRTGPDKTGPFEDRQSHRGPSVPLRTAFQTRQLSPLPPVTCHNNEIVILCLHKNQ